MTCKSGVENLEDQRIERVYFESIFCALLKKFQLNNDRKSAQRGREASAGQVSNSMF